MFLGADSTRSSNFVDLDIGPLAWAILVGIVVVLLGIDLIRHRDDHVGTTREVALESSLWVACGLMFGVGVWTVWGGEAFGEYLAGYLIEKSLSVDNVFVWSLLFTTMSIPLKYQHRVLFWGIFGALALRLIFILVGAALIQQFFWLLIVFGVFLIFSGIKVIRHTEDEGHGSKQLGRGLLERFIPVSNEFDGHNFFTMKNGVRMATPLFAALVVVELTDVIFAIDSVPAVLAVSHEPYLVFASNAFAILGLRAMYFLLANARERFHYLSHGLGAILIFVGAKMAVSHWYHLDTYVSLGIIVTLLVAAVIFSELWSRKQAAAHHSH